MDNIIPFPSHKVGIKRGDKLAVVTSAEDGKATSLKIPEKSQEIAVFAHADFVVRLAVGDWVRFDITRYGAIILERLAQPGECPLPRVDYVDGQVYMDFDDPIWRLYRRAKTMP